MSRRKDQARAESGLLMRSGKLIPAEDVPGSRQNKERQAKVGKEIRIRQSLSRRGVVIVSGGKLVSPYK